MSESSSGRATSGPIHPMVRTAIFEGIWNLKIFKKKAHDVGQFIWNPDARCSPTVNDWLKISTVHHLLMKSETTSVEGRRRGPEESKTRQVEKAVRIVSNSSFFDSLCRQI